MAIKDALAVVLLCLLVTGAWWRQRAIKRLIHDLERNAETQYNVHRVATWYWVLNFPVVAVMFFGFPDLWVRVGLLLNTFYSLYANLSTDYGALSAAIAARQSQIPRDSGGAQLVRLALLQKTVDQIGITLEDVDRKVSDLEGARHDDCG